MVSEIRLGSAFFSSCFFWFFCALLRNGLEDTKRGKVYSRCFYTVVMVWYLPSETNLRQMELLLVVLGDTDSELFC